MWERNMKRIVGTLGMAALVAASALTTAGPAAAKKAGGGIGKAVAKTVAKAAVVGAAVMVARKLTKKQAQVEKVHDLPRSAELQTEDGLPIDLGRITAGRGKGEIVGYVSTREYVEFDQAFLRDLVVQHTRFASVDDLRAHLTAQDRARAAELAAQRKEQAAQRTADVSPAGTGSGLRLPIIALLAAVITAVMFSLWKVWCRLSASPTRPAGTPAPTRPTPTVPRNRTASAAFGQNRLRPAG
jgi:uncharacterized membrane protein